MKKKKINYAKKLRNLGIQYVLVSTLMVVIIFTGWYLLVKQGIVTYEFFGIHLTNSVITLFILSLCSFAASIFWIKKNILEIAVIQWGIGLFLICLGIISQEFVFGGF